MVHSQVNRLEATHLQKEDCEHWQDSGSLPMPTINSQVNWLEAVHLQKDCKHWHDAGNLPTNSSI